MRTTLFATAIMYAAAPVAGLEITDLEFVGGSDPSGYDRYGKPTSAYSISDTLPTDVLSNVYSMLPEGAPVNPDFIAADSQSSIAIDDELEGADFATVSVTFLNEGAGYRNTFGYFIFDTANPPATIDDIASHVVIFPNASKPNAGTLSEGDTMDLNIEVREGETIGFFVIPNGWGWSGSYNNIESLGGWGTPFYSLSDLNPESTAINRRHSVAFVDPQNESLILGFEDLLRPAGDNDFNDILFTVDVTPFQAIDGVNADGSIDASYEILTQINDPAITTTSVYPAADRWATLAFEDKWPLMGDYDFNDLVLRQRITETLDGQRNVKSIQATYEVQAMGGTYHNGFAVRLPGITAADLDAVTLTRNGSAVTHDVVESDYGDINLIISPDTRQDVQDLGVLSAECRLYRAEPGCIASQTEDLVFELSVAFAAPIARETLGRPPYDPFIFGSPGKERGNMDAPGRSWETHLKAFSGTGALNTGYYDTEDDASNGINSFVTQNNFPWVLNLSDNWSHPLEKIDISRAYPDFSLWVTSGGEQKSNWYQRANAVASRIAD